MVCTKFFEDNDFGKLGYYAMAAFYLVFGVCGFITPYFTGTRTFVFSSLTFTLHMLFLYLVARGNEVFNFGK